MIAPSCVLLVTGHARSSVVQKVLPTSSDGKSWSGLVSGTVRRSGPWGSEDKDVLELEPRSDTVLDSINRVSEQSRAGKLIEINGN